MPNLGLGLGLNTSNAPSVLLPRDVPGNVLSLVAKKANKGQNPIVTGATATKVFSDQSKIRNSISYSNIAPNGNFVDTSNYTTIGSGFAWSVLNNEGIITNLSSSGSGFKLYTAPQFSVILGHKYYAREWMKSNSSSDGIATTAPVYGAFSKNHSGSGNYELLSLIATATATGTDSIRVLNTTRTGDISANPVKIKEFMSFDLTALGLDHLSLTQCDELFSFTATSSTTSMANDVTINNTISSVGSGFNKVGVVNGKGTSVQYTNFVTNPNFVGTTGWTNLGTASVIATSGNVLTNTANGSVYYPTTNQDTTLNAVAGKRVYNRCMTRVTTTSCLSIQIYGADTGNLQSYTIANPIQNTWYPMSVIATMVANTGVYKTKILHVYADAATSNGKVQEVKEYMTVNLSDNTYVQALEAALGRVLTVDECDRLFAFTSSTGNVRVDTQYALSLDGTDDYGSMANVSSLDITTNEFVLACTFRAPSNSATGFLLFKGLDSGTNSQYYMLFDTVNKRIQLCLNGTIYLSTTNNSTLENVWYNVIFYRNSSGLISSYINKVANYTTTNNTALISQPNVRIGARSNNVGGTTHSTYFKGDIDTISIYQLATLDIAKIIKAETNVSKDYTGVT